MLTLGESLLRMLTTRQMMKHCAYSFNVKLKQYQDTCGVSAKLYKCNFKLTRRSWFVILQLPILNVKYAVDQ